MKQFIKKTPVIIYRLHNIVHNNSYIGTVVYLSSSRIHFEYISNEFQSEAVSPYFCSYGIWPARELYTKQLRGYPVISTEQ